MIQFQRMGFSQKAQYERILFSAPERGCEYSFSNLFLWGKQHVAFDHGCALFFSHFSGHSVYPYPIGSGDKKAAIDAILQDAVLRGIPCRITGITPADQEELEALFPGKFHFRSVRNNFDYVYDIHDLADLRGRKYQKKRNHYNRFWADHPNCRVLPLTREFLDPAREMVEDWYDHRAQIDPDRDYLLEQLAIYKAFQHFPELHMEGLILEDDGQILAVTMASRLSGNTFDIHFEKARESVHGAYAAINCEFARYLRLKYPEVAFMNREDDLGIEGLRKAKLEYKPHHMVKKSWAYLWEDIYAD